jgi:hypothetical protein
MQVSVQALMRPVANVCMSELSGLALACFESGPPLLLAPDGSLRQIPVNMTCKVHGILDPKERFILLGVERGFVLLLDPVSFGVLDAVQVRSLRLVYVSGPADWRSIPVWRMSFAFNVI